MLTNLVSIACYLKSLHSFCQTTIFSIRPDCCIPGKDLQYQILQLQLLVPSFSNKNQTLISQCLNSQQLEFKFTIFIDLIKIINTWSKVFINNCLIFYIELCKMNYDLRFTSTQSNVIINFVIKPFNFWLINYYSKLYNNWTLYSMKNHKG